MKKMLYLCNMAKIRYSGTVNGVSGKLGDEVHSHTRNRKYAKKATTKEFIKTEGRARTMDSFAVRISGWNKLTDSQIDVWEDRARALRLRSIGQRTIIQTGRELHNYINLNLHEIGEPPRIYAPNFDYPQYILNMTAQFIKESEPPDIRLDFKTEIQENTRIIIYATHSLKRGQRQVENSWYKKIGVIGSEFKSGDSILARYLRVFDTILPEMYKISFKYREVHKISGISNLERPFVMYSEPDFY